MTSRTANRDGGRCLMSLGRQAGSGCPLLAGGRVPGGWRSWKAVEAVKDVQVYCCLLLVVVGRPGCRHVMAARPGCGPGGVACRVGCSRPCI